MNHGAASAAQLAVEVVPATGGPLLLAIHGMLSSRLQWTRNKAALAQFCRPVLIDLWGHGQSPAPLDDAEYSVDGLVQAIDRVRQRFDADKILLCTQSFGAGLGLHYCVRYPDRVIAHLFTNSISALSSPQAFDRSRNREQRIATIEQHGQDGLRQMPFHPSNAKRMEPAVRDLLIEAADQVDPQAFIRLTGQTRPQISAIERLEQIQCPTLLVNGRWEKGFQPLRDEAVARMPGLKVVDLDGGHAVNIECADQFNTAARDFFCRYW